MRDDLGGRTFCPHYKDVKLLPCPRPPPIDLLLREFHRICGSYNLLNNCSEDELRLAEKRWLLGIVSTITPIEEIFRKDYHQPARTQKLSDMKTVDIKERFNEHRTSILRKNLVENIWLLPESALTKTSLPRTTN